jgi:hypothetical protein
VWILFLGNSLNRVYFGRVTQSISEGLMKAIRRHCDCVIGVLGPRKHFQEKASTQRSLHCAPVEMTKGRAVLPGTVVAEQEPFCSLDENIDERKQLFVPVKAAVL